jgi:hypothetical protein
MSRVYKSAKGKLVDMDKVKLSNENVPAIGNMRVNARGDIISDGGQVTVPRNEIMDRIYTVESASAPYSPNDPAAFTGTQQMIENSKAKKLHDLANNLVTATSQEPIVEDTPTDAAPTRGSLAASVAKKQTVNQQAMPNPKKANGPTRI